MCAAWVLEAATVTGYTVTASDKVGRNGNPKEKPAKELSLRLSKANYAIAGA